jgi:hypothetical protein
VFDDLDQVLALKASAKSARDDNDWDGALSDLHEAIDVLQDLADASQPPPSWLASELADTYGLIGGIHKRWGLLLDGEQRQRHLAESMAAYDKGFMYERELQPNDANTYNRVNRLVSRVLLDKLVLLRDVAGGSQMVEELREAEEILVQEIGTARQKDPWAYCDLGTIRLLRGKPDALPTLHELDRLRPPSFVYESTLATLQPLCEVASDLRPDLAQAITQLQRSARYSDQAFPR